MKNCPACGAKVSEGNLFCHRCGKYLRVCPRCNFEVPRDALSEVKYCPECGHPLFDFTSVPEIIREVKWSVWDVFKILILSIFLAIPFVFLLSFVFTSFADVTGAGVPLLVALSSFHLLLLIFTVYYVRKRGGSLREMGITAANPKFIGVGILLGFALPVLDTVISFLTEPIIGSSPMQEEIIKMAEAPGMFPEFLFFASVIAPIIEEIYFRGFSFQAFKNKWGSNWGIFACSIFFAFLHFDPWVFLHILAMGLVLAYAYEKTGSLPLVMTAHLLNNALAFLI